MMIHQRPVVPPTFPPNPHLELLRKVPLFAHLGPVQLVALYRRMTVKRWYSGAIIVGQGEPGDGLYVVFQGRTKRVLFGDSGREMTLSVLRPGATFGEVSLMDGRPRQSNVMALDDVVLLRLARDAFEQHLERDPRLAIKVSRALASRTRQAVEVINNLALHDVHSRLRRTLVLLAEETGEPHDGGMLLRRRPTQQELANMVGTCRETISRTLTAMSRQGLVKSRGRTLWLSRAMMDGLREAA